MSPPDRAAHACEAVQTELQAFLIDRERPSESATALWDHVAACDRCAQALGHDRALRRALERLRGGARAPARLRERLRRMLSTTRGENGGRGPAPDGPARRRGPGGGSRST
jgi:anti-sigma factor (TIGR02949 family)